MAPRVVRKKPFRERLSSWFNLMDHLLWLSEEIETRDWDSATVGTRMGLAANLIFLIARANSAVAGSDADDDLFSDNPGSGWFSYLVSLFVWILTIFSILNAGYTFTRSRSYRLFQLNAERSTAPDTPNAHRVRVQSSPAAHGAAASPFRMLASVLPSSYETAESRAHPDKTRDVWELSVWDPLPLSLRMFCLFSPGHVLVYYMFLPLITLDPRPSVTVFNCIVLQILLSVQVLSLQSQYAQQIHDAAIVHREVMREYDDKFVHPRRQRLVRDAGTQLAQMRDGRRVEHVSVGTPTTLIAGAHGRKGTFETHPNPNYLRHIDPERLSVRSSGYSKTGIFSPTPTPAAAATTTSNMRGMGSGLTTSGKTHLPPQQREQKDSGAGGEGHTLNPFASRSKLRQSPAVRRSLPAQGVSFANPDVPQTTTTSTSTSTSTSTGTGLSSAVKHRPQQVHPSSPLRKATSMGDIGARGATQPPEVLGYEGKYEGVVAPSPAAAAVGEAQVPPSPRNSREMAAYETAQYESRRSRGGGRFSGAVRHSSLTKGHGYVGGGGRGGQEDGYGGGGSGRRGETQRYPSRW